MAARDYGTIMAPFNLAFQGAVSEHHDRLGLSLSQRRNYLNSGVIRADRYSWATLSEAAIEFFMRNPDACEPFHDQGALNGACIEALVPISIRWNFPRQFMHLHLEGAVKPAIYHFMAHPKPWHGSFLPWGRHHSRPYRNAVVKYPHIRDLHHKLGGVRSAAYALKTTKQFWHAVLTGPNSEAVGREIRNETYAI
jgi:lipopolysaccharide biosynthesis glycosyltransferase